MLIHYGNVRFAANAFDARPDLLLSAPVLTRKSVLIAAVDVVVDDGYA
jgi:hypothetical protein